MLQKNLKDSLGFNYLFKNHPHPMWIYDLKNLSFLVVNDSAVFKYGYSIDDFHKMTVLDIRPPSDGEQLVSLFNDSMPEFQVISGKHKLKSGEIIDVEESLHLIHVGHRKLALAMVRDITIELKTSMELKQKEILLEEVESIAKVGGWELDPVTMSGTGTKEAADIFDLDPVDNFNMFDAVKYLVKNSVDLMTTALNNLIETGKEYDLELEFISAAGYKKWIRAIGKAVYENGKLIKIRGTIQDITEEKNIAKKINITKSRLADAQKVAKIGSWDIEPGGLKGYWSDELFRLFGLEVSDTPPTFEDYLNMIHPDDREHLKDVLQSFLKGILPPVFSFRTNPERGDVRYLYPTYKVERNASGEIVKYFGTVQDITELKMKDNQILEKTEELDYFFNNSLELFAIISTEGIFQKVNLQWEKVFGYRPDELIGLQSLTLVHPDDLEETLKVMNSELQESGELIDFVNRMRTKDGLYKKIEWRTHRKGNIFYSVARDISIQEEIIQELKRTRQNAESSNKLKDNFIANISHEIRSPLNGILGLIELVKEEFQDKITPDVENLFTGIGLASKRIIRTVDMILNYSRLKSGLFVSDKGNMDLGLVCSNLVTEYSFHASAKNLELEFINNTQNSNLYSDEYCITEIISNLIDNAIKYTNKGKVTVTLNETITDYEVEVKDTGIGMSPEFLQHFHEPYKQEEMGYGRAYEGVGLGLALVDQLTKYCNTELKFESEKGLGSTFTIVIHK